MELSPILLCLLAAVPVLLLIILLVGCKWSVGRAAVVSVAVDAVIALSAFGAHPLQILVSAAKGAWSSLSIILIICPAILMYNIVREAGAFRVIRAGIQQATPNKLLQILIIGYAFAAFLQGITGFGVPVAICAPLLIEIGVSPLWALAIAPLGEAWGNTFGTLSAAWDALAAQAGLNEAMPLYWQSALWTASFLFAMNLVSGLLVCWFYGKGPALRRGLPHTAGFRRQCPVWLLGGVGDRPQNAIGGISGLGDRGLFLGAGALPHPPDRGDPDAYPAGLL